MPDKDSSEFGHETGSAVQMAQQVALLRIMDAAANRAAEGIRVAEDVVRFVWNDAHLCHRLKQARHRVSESVAKFDRLERMRARDTLSDVGTDIRTNQEVARADVDSLLTANLRRAQEALRTLAECSKAIQPTSPDLSGLAESYEQIRYDIYTLERAATMLTHSSQRLEHVHICALVGATCEATFEKRVCQLVSANVGMIQLREKSLNDSDLMKRATLLRQLTSGTGSLCIINDRPDIAAAVSADGVHLGQDDMPITEARKVIGTAHMIGISTHSIEQARQAVLNGADYLGVGPTFPSQTKAFDDFSGLEFVRQIADEIGLPAFAIGGIDEKNIKQVAASGLRRIAVQNALDCDDLNLVAGRLRQHLQNGSSLNQPEAPV